MIDEWRYNPDGVVTTENRARYANYRSHVIDVRPKLAKVPRSLDGDEGRALPADEKLEGMPQRETELGEGPPPRGRRRA